MAHKTYNELDSVFFRERGRLQSEMQTEAAAAILQIEGVNADIDPSDFGKLETQDDGTTLFTWRGKPVLLFGFKPSAKVGKGLELTVDRLHLAQ
ncbi:hypothetical protein Pcar_1816 [Syntrophotalea carbinolica DSM 2380]|uniref:Uncharacterized protein n=1 Tax=Syntrophotalea carbinolica (strain DSM 2380 / NBRC 103641 / GraBd1) TaxID=338963 RepID=Q3A3K0_SYNC1|nr:hypothetical protein [Syntrophotalea carbinolica]ABA89057.1 hypothetical protein Pcar_1816 [Syntrophotalea carbinolica DSM 2380]